MNTDQTPIDPNRLSVEQLSQILGAAANQPIDPQVIQNDIAAGAPTNTDGTVNVVNYAAWLVKEMARGS
jgi:hypothetical protein